MLGEDALFEALAGPLGKIVGIFEDVALEEILVRMVKDRFFADDGYAVAQLAQVLRLFSRRLEDADGLLKIKGGCLSFHRGLSFT